MHTLLVRSEGAWVPGGDDTATPNGPSECLLFDFVYDLQLMALAILTKTYLLFACQLIRCCSLRIVPEFDNEYHDWLINKLEADRVAEFQKTMDPENMKPFDKEFLNWFQVSPEVTRDPNLKLDHLDSDLVLAFPSLFPLLSDSHHYPNYHEDTVRFAESNDVFLQTFFPALDKMSKLGVDVHLQSPGSGCACGSGGTSNSNYATAESEYEHLVEEIKDIGSALALAEEELEAKQYKRKDEISLVTTPLHVAGSRSGKSVKRSGKSVKKTNTGLRGESSYAETE